MNRTAIFSIFILAFIAGFIYNELNLYFAKQENPPKTNHNYTIKHPDNAWYTPQIKHLLDGNGYTLAPQEPEMTVRRTPVYPLFYGFHYVLFGEAGAHFFIRYTQLLLFAISSVLLALAVFNFSANKRWAFITGICHALLPFVSAYSYNVLTEGISISLVIFTIYSYSLYRLKNKNKHLFITGLLLGITFLTRPLIGLLLPAIALSLVDFRKLTQKDYLKSLFLKQSILGIGFALLLSPWILRNYAVRGEFIVGEKIYGDPMDFGMAHTALRALSSCWTNTGNGEIETLSGKLLRGIPNNDSTSQKQIIQNFIDQQPTSIFNTINKDSFKDALFAFYECHKEAWLLKNANSNFLRKDRSNMACDKNLSKLFLDLKENYIKKNGYDYYFAAPMKNLFVVVFQSHSNSYFFLNTTPLNFIQKAIKGIFYITHVLLYLSFIVFCFTKKDELINHLRFIMAFMVFSSILFFVFYLRHCENRYTIPIFPFLHISFAYFLVKTLDFFSALRKK